MTNYRKSISNDIDLSHINHFLIYYAIGLVYPDNYMVALLLTFLWEVFEVIIVQNDTLYCLTKTHWVVPEKYWNENLENKFFDVIANLCGYFVGSYHQRQQ